MGMLILATTELWLGARRCVNDFNPPSLLRSHGQLVSGHLQNRKRAQRPPPRPHVSDGQAEPVLRLLRGFPASLMPLPMPRTCPQNETSASQKDPTGSHGQEAGGHCDTELSRVLQGWCSGWLGAVTQRLHLEGCDVGADAEAAADNEGPYEVTRSWGQDAQGLLLCHVPLDCSSHARHTWGPFQVSHTWGLQVFKGSHLHAQSVSY